jgi:hypothetical protein
MPRRKFRLVILEGIVWMTATKSTDPTREPYARHLYALKVPYKGREESRLYLTY